MTTSTEDDQHHDHDHIVNEEGHAVVKADTPLPKRSLAVVFLVRLSEPVNFSFILPFINSYVWDLQVTQDRSKVGVYAGWIESIFAICQLFTVLQWATLSDRIGRRPILITGCLGLVASAIAFGLAQSYAMAVLARSLAGLLNGNVALLRSVVGELCDDTNVAKAASILGLCWNVGAAIGPFLGGALVFPARRFPTVFGNQDAPLYMNGLWWHRPYLLPCLAVASLSMTSFIVTVLFLPETLPSKVAERERKKKAKALAAAGQHGIEAGRLSSREDERTLLLNGRPHHTADATLTDSNGHAYGTHLSVHDDAVTTTTHDAGEAGSSSFSILHRRHPHLTDRHVLSPDMVDPNSSGFSLGLSHQATAARDDEALGGVGLDGEDGAGGPSDASPGPPASSDPTTSSWSILTIPHVQSVLLSFCALSFCGAGFEAIVVLFFYEPLQLGGLHFSPAQTGTYLGCSAIFSMVVQTILTSILIRRMGTTRLYRHALFCFPAMALLLPLASAVARWGSAGHEGGEADPLPLPTYVAVYAILIVYGVLRCFSAFGYAANLLLVNECALLTKGAHLGAMNGYSTMAGCIARATGPALYTYLYSLTVSPTLPPLLGKGWLIWAVLFGSGALAGWSTCFIRPIGEAVRWEEERRARVGLSRG